MEKRNSAAREGEFASRPDAMRAELLAMTRGYMRSQAVLTASGIGLFEALGEGPRSLRALARRVRCSLRGVRALADALTTLGLLVREGEMVRNADLTQDLLVSGGENYIGHLLQHQSHMYDRWGQLDRAVRTGRPVGQPSNRGLRRERFMRAMVEASRRSIPEVLELLDLSQCRRCLDLGGGFGAYAIAFAERWPHLEAVLFDVPDVIRMARSYLRRQGLQGRIECIAGDALKGRLGGPYDAIFISNLLHIFSRRENASVLRRAARALSPGGTITIKDFVLRSDRSGPVWAGLFALNMLIATERGGAYTDAEYEEMLGRAGLRLVARHEIGEASVLLMAKVREAA